MIDRTSIGFILLLAFLVVGIFDIYLTFKYIPHQKFIPEVSQEEIFFVEGPDRIEKVNYSEVYIKSSVSCDSNSMGLTLNCKSQILSRAVLEDEFLTEGNIYVYQNSKEDMIVHRLVKCLDSQCNSMVFKGDNNLLADELVQKPQVLEEVCQIRLPCGVKKSEG